MRRSSEPEVHFDWRYRMLMLNNLHAEGDEKVPFRAFVLWSSVISGLFTKTSVWRLYQRVASIGMLIVFTMEFQDATKE